MKIVFIGAFPPSKLGLNEHSAAMVEEIKNIPGVELYVLADKLPERLKSQEIIPDGFKLIRCWQSNHFFAVFQIAKELKKIKPDLVWYNLLFSTFGSRKPQAFFGLLSPMLSKVKGFKTIITLHHLIEFIEFRHTKYKRFSVMDRAAGFIATKLLLQADYVFLTLEKYVHFLKKKYKAKNVHCISLGLLEKPCFMPVSHKRNILIFGKFGSYKKIDFITEVYLDLKKQMPDVSMTIAGRSHPAYPGYIETCVDKYKDVPDLKFTGYVPQEKIRDIFGESSVLVLPYDSTTGVSGPVHLACAYARPVIASRLPDLVTMAKEENLAMETFEVSNHEEAKTALMKVLSDQSLQEAMGRQNFEALKDQSMNAVIAQYMDFIQKHVLSQSRIS